MVRKVGFSRFVALVAAIEGRSVAACIRCSKRDLVNVDLRSR